MLMKRGQKPTEGFTLVELLIVIVVVAILAVITIVSYDGIQDRAHDSAVRGDLSTATKLFDIYRIDNARYPSSVADVESMNDRLEFSRSSYMTSNNAVLVCRTNDGSGFAMLGKSMSGTTFLVTESQRVPSVYTGSFPAGLSVVCPAVASKYPSGYWLHGGTGWVI